MRRGIAGAQRFGEVKNYRKLVHVIPAWVCWLEPTEVKFLHSRTRGLETRAASSDVGGNTQLILLAVLSFLRGPLCGGLALLQMQPQAIRNDVPVCSPLYRLRLKSAWEDRSEEPGHVLVKERIFVTCILTTRKKLDKWQTISFSWTYQKWMSEQTANLKFRERSGERNRRWAFAYPGREHHLPCKLLGRRR